jgi:hypothetical protein
VKSDTELSLRSIAPSIRLLKALTRLLPLPLRLSRFCICEVRRRKGWLHFTKRIQPRHHARELLSNFRIARHDLSIHISQPNPLPIFLIAYYLKAEAIAFFCTIYDELNLALLGNILFSNFISICWGCESDDSLAKTSLLMSSNADACETSVILLHYRTRLYPWNLELKVKLCFLYYRLMSLLSQEKRRYYRH